MHGFHFEFLFESHDPGRPLPGRVQMRRREEEDAVDLVLRLLGYVTLFEPGLELNGPSLSEDAPLIPGLVLHDEALEPVLWAESRPEDFKRVKKISVKAPRARLVFLEPSPERADLIETAARRQHIKPGRCTILHFESGLVEEMTETLARRNTFAWIPGDDPAINLQFDFNGLWFESSFSRHDF